MINIFYLYKISCFSDSWPIFLHDWVMDSTYDGLPTVPIIIRSLLKHDIDQSDMGCTHLPASNWMNLCKSQMNYIIISKKSASDLSSFTE